MKLNRRSFIKSGAMALTAAAFLPQYSCSSSGKTKKGIVGVQLYSIREEMSIDPVGSMKKVAEMGYKHVEHANYVDGRFYGFAPAEFRKILDDIGLIMISGHTVMEKDHWDESRNDFSDSWKKLVDDAAILGQKYVVSPWMDDSMRSTYDDFMHYIEVFNKCGELCQSRGMKFGYHNHDFEFSEELNNEKLFDIMMKNMDPDKVVLQLDTGNLYNGGAVALDVVSQYPGRFEIIHVKDEILSPGGNEKYESTVIGKGIINAREVLELTTSIGGTEVYIIEQESYQGKTPMECIREDLEVMKKWGYA